MAVGFGETYGGAPGQGQAEKQQSAGRDHPGSEPGGTATLGIGPGAIQEQGGSEDSAGGEAAFGIRVALQTPAASASPGWPAAGTGTLAAMAGRQREPLDEPESGRVPEVA